jgi:hypothetical protein
VDTRRDRWLAGPPGRQPERAPGPYLNTIGPRAVNALGDPLGCPSAARYQCKARGRPLACLPAAIWRAAAPKRPRRACLPRGRAKGSPGSRTAALPHGKGLAAVRPGPLPSWAQRGQGRQCIAFGNRTTITDTTTATIHTRRQSGGVKMVIARSRETTSTDPAAK